MKIFAISLDRSKERKSYITSHLKSLKSDFEIVEGVDGRKLNEEDIQKYCFLEARKKNPDWLSNGAIACALSHLSVYEKIIEQNLEYAMIVEDDIVLPKDINKIIFNCGKNLKPGEVILLYYTSFKECKLSTHRSKTIQNSNLKLYYPMNPSQPISGAAYIVHRTTALSLSESILPIKVTADSWGYFLNNGIISSLRCLYPLILNTKNFKSSIDYFDHKSIKGRFLNWIDQKRFPAIFQLIAWKRKRTLTKMTNLFTITNENPTWL